ncbi:uncharacterized protein LOC130591265 [Beta vulgaris subsp. vulgaris]|uniref:uncharacterized protein LOC130591265 n=1 Tax=Beta vulgaris subsp. vulgaris TaxID=3555 RepID=UPI00254720DC|nr:uncharacterized protein LOC130591265 [Beta vulgaris subsp. vulgaris]
MKSASSGSSSWRSAERVTLCYHNTPPKLRTTKTRGLNYGRKFYGCALWPKSDCGFFLWVDENQIGDVEDHSREKEMLIDELLNEKGFRRKSAEAEEEERTTGGCPN